MQTDHIRIKAGQSMGRNKQFSFLLLAALASSFLTSCGTRLNWGDALVPAHANSYHQKNEEVIVEVEALDSVHKKEGDSAPRNVGARAVAGPLIALGAEFVAEQATEFVANELEKEAKKYTQQYSGRLRSSFGPGRYRITMYRLIDGTDVESNEEWSFDRPGLDWKGMFTGKQSGSGISGDKDAMARKPKEYDDFSYQIGSKKGKHVASAYIFELAIEAAGMSGTGDDKSKIFIGSLDLKRIYFSHAKVKVVGFNEKTPWHWAGNLIFDSGSKVDVDIHAQLKSVTDYSENLVIMDSHLPASGSRIDLSEASRKEHKGLGDWLVLGRVGGDEKGGGAALLTLDLVVTERDPSNAQKLFGDAATVVREEGKGALQNLLLDFAGQE